MDLADSLCATTNCKGWPSSTLKTIGHDSKAIHFSCCCGSSGMVCVDAVDLPKRKCAAHCETQGLVMYEIDGVSVPNKCCCVPDRPYHNPGACHDPSICRRKSPFNLDTIGIDVFFNEFAEYMEKIDACDCKIAVTPKQHMDLQYFLEFTNKYPVEFEKIMYDILIETPNYTIAQVVKHLKSLESSTEFLLQASKTQNARKFAEFVGPGPKVQPPKPEIEKEKEEPGAQKPKIVKETEEEDVPQLRSVNDKCTTMTHKTPNEFIKACVDKCGFQMQAFYSTDFEASDMVTKSTIKGDCCCGAGKKSRCLNKEICKATVNPTIDNLRLSDPEAIQKYAHLHNQRNACDCPINYTKKQIEIGNKFADFMNEYGEEAIQKVADRLVRLNNHYTLSDLVRELEQESESLAKKKKDMIHDNTSPAQQQQKPTFNTQVLKEKIPGHPIIDASAGSFTQGLPASVMMRELEYFSNDGKEWWMFWAQIVASAALIGAIIYCLRFRK